MDTTKLAVLLGNVAEQENLPEAGARMVERVMLARQQGLAVEVIILREEDYKELTVWLGCEEEAREEGNVLTFLGIPVMSLESGEALLVAHDPLEYLDVPRSD